MVLGADVVLALHIHRVRLYRRKGLEHRGQGDLVETFGKFCRNQVLRLSTLLVSSKTLAHLAHETQWEERVKKTRHPEKQVLRLQ